MKRTLMALTVMAGIAVGLSTAGCSTTIPGTPTKATPWGAAAALPSASRPPRSVTYARQVVLPFGEFINFLGGVTVDTAGNVYALDLVYGRVWKMAAAASKPTPLPFTGLGRTVDAAVDPAGNLYVTDDLKERVLELTPGSTSPTPLPFGDLTLNPPGESGDSSSCEGWSHVRRFAA